MAVQRQSRSLLKFMRIAHAEGKNWREELNRFLLTYKSTPHSTTGKSPAELLFKRKLTVKIPELVNVEEEKVEVSNQAVRDQDTQRKQFNKDYVDKRFHTRDRNVREGDSVLLEKKKENKLSPRYETEPCQVITRYGTRWCYDHHKAFSTNATFSILNPSLCQIQKNRKQCYRMLNPILNLGHLRRHLWQRIKYSSSLRPGSKALTGENNLLVTFLKI